MPRTSLSVLSSLAATFLAACATGHGGGEGRPDVDVVSSTRSALGLSAGFESGYYLPFNNVLLASADGAKAVANGNAALTFIEPVFDGTLDENDQLATFSSTINLRGALTLEVRVDAAGEFSESIPLPPTVLPAFQVGQHIVVTPYAFTTLNFGGTASATASASVVAPFEASVAFSLKAPGLGSAPKFKPELGSPEASGAMELSVTADVGVVFVVMIDGVVVGGPAVATSLGVDLHLATSPVPSWSVDLSNQVSAGWSFDPTTGMPDPAKHFPKKEWRVVSGVLPRVLPATRWSRIYDLQTAEHAATAVATRAGVTVVGNTGLGSGSWMTSLDGGGLPRWQKANVAQPGAEMRARSMVEASNGDFLVAGHAGLSGGMRVERYAAGGAPQWARTMAGGAAQSGIWNATVPTSGGGAILGGHIATVGGPTRLLLAEIDRAGSLLWSTEVDLGPGTNAPVLNALAQTASGQILAAGSVEFVDVSAAGTLAQSNGYVLRLDAGGAPLSAVGFGGPYLDQVATLAVFPDDSYAVGGRSVPTTGEENWAWIASFEASDAMRWSATYASETRGAYDVMTGLGTLPSRGLLVAGGGEGFADGISREAWLLRVDEAGMPVWFKSLRGPSDDTLTGVVKVKDGLLAFGSTRSVNDVAPVPQTDLWVVRTSVDGMVHFTPESGMTATNDAVRWKRSSHLTKALTPTGTRATLTAAVAPLAVTNTPATTELLSR